MATLTPETDVGAALATALGLVDGTAIKYGPPRAAASVGNTGAIIWVTPYGGQAPEPFLNAAVDGSFYLSSVQVLIRGAPDAFQAGLATARQVRDALHTKQPAAYVSWLVNSSEPLYLGPNEVGEHEWTVNITARWKATL
jgi:hypothetical protein